MKSQNDSAQKCWDILEDAKKDTKIGNWTKNIKEQFDDAYWFNKIYFSGNSPIGQNPGLKT